MGWKIIFAPQALEDRGYKAALLSNDQCPELSFNNRKQKLLCLLIHKNSAVKSPLSPAHPKVSAQPLRPTLVTPVLPSSSIIPRAKKARIVLSPTSPARAAKPSPCRRTSPRNPISIAFSPKP